jgi:uroporphyrinogen-III decarboxylase
MRCSPAATLSSDVSASDRRKPRPRQYYLDLAAGGLAMPIGADLVLREKPDVNAILLDGQRLGAVVAEAARHYRTPLAIPLMDLMLEKQAMLVALGFPADQVEQYHFDAPPTDEMLATLDDRLARSELPRMHAHVEAVHFVAQQPDLVPIGMCIGPFSLMTRLLSEPIVPVYQAGRGITAEQNRDVAAVERCLDLALRTILFSIDQQLAAGAETIFIAEPAANQVYISPRQLEAGSDIFERYVMRPNRRIRERIEQAGAQLIFHCCGELSPHMLRGFASLEPTILSLGSSRRLWEDAAIVPRTTVLYGNIPSKKFFMDAEITEDQVRTLAKELVSRMREVGHPFILGSECDVLSVVGYEDTIRRKVAAMLECRPG